MDIFDNENKMCDFMSSDFENFKYSPLFEDNMNSVSDLSSNVSYIYIYIYIHRVYYI